jgi:SP family sugar:H+ symporter-like MFS transporter
MFVVGLVYTVWPNSPSAGKCLVAFVFIYSFVLAGTITPYAFVVGTEIPNQRLRAYTLAVLFTASYAATWVVSFTLPYYINPAKLDWGAKYGISLFGGVLTEAWLWFPANLFMGIFVFFFIPETKDRTLEEIDEMFEMRVAARKFSSYTCVGIQQAVEGGPIDKLGVEVQNTELNEMPPSEHA